MDFGARTWGEFQRPIIVKKKIKFINKKKPNVIGQISSSPLILMLFAMYLLVCFLDKSIRTRKMYLQAYTL